MRPETTLDWIAFWFLIIGALAWGYFVTDVNVLDLVLEKIWDPLDDVVFVLIAASGLYAALRAFWTSEGSTYR